MTARSPQARTLAAREKIVAGAVSVLAQGGVAALTHRAVARAAGVSLASTTYHFATIGEILETASRDLLDGYCADFERLRARLAAGQDVGIRSFEDLVHKVTLKALTRARSRSLAWCEIMLQGGRSAGGQALAADWYQRLAALWGEIGACLAIPAGAVEPWLDRAIGTTFLLHPLRLSPEVVAGVLSGSLVLGEGVEDMPAALIPPAAEPLDTGHARGRILAAAIQILCEGGASALTHRAVAERAMMVRSGPSYHFPSIEGLLQAAETQLAWRARQRYRAGMEAATEAGPAAPGDAAKLADLTTTIFLREVLEFPAENLGAYSAWIAAARSMQPNEAVAAQIIDINRGWQRRLAALAVPPVRPGLTALHLQAGFIGRLVRQVSGGRNLSQLALLREAFAAEIGDAALK